LDEPQIHWRRLAVAAGESVTRLWLERLEALQQCQAREAPTPTPIGAHSGAVIHHQYQSIWPVSRSAINDAAAAQHPAVSTKSIQKVLLIPPCSWRRQSPHLSPASCARLELSSVIPSGATRQRHQGVDLGQPISPA